MDAACSLEDGHLLKMDQSTSLSGDDQDAASILHVAVTDLSSNAEENDTDQKIFRSNAEDQGQHGGIFRNNAEDQEPALRTSEIMRRKILMSISLNLDLIKLMLVFKKKMI